MSIKKSFLQILAGLVLLSCAAQSPATGGPKDSIGPQLVSVHPENGSLNISSQQKITLIFDEMLDPVSVPASISSKDDVELKIKTRSRTITIQSENEWPKNQPIRISVSRRIRDYQGNSMAAPVQLIYSTKNELPRNNIAGNILNANTEAIVEIGLYQWPKSDSALFLQKVEADEYGSFKFQFIDSGKYIISALESVISDFGLGMRNFRYGMIPLEFVELNGDSNYITVNLLLTDPLKRLRIQSADIPEQYSAKLIMTDGSEEFYVIDSVYSPGDSIIIKMKKQNRLENYQLPHYSFILPAIDDTSGPAINQSYFNKTDFLISFSEPLTIDSASVLISLDSLDISLPFEFENAFTIKFPDLPDSISAIKLLGAGIRDWIGNISKDSLRVIQVMRTVSEETIGGNILGLIEYDGEHPVWLEAENINSGKHYGFASHGSQFTFQNLPHGFYKIWGFEAINKQDSTIYFSGTWEPYQRAARFAFYPDSIEVRARWDIEGIILKFE